MKNFITEPVYVEEHMTTTWPELQSGDFFCFVGDDNGVDLTVLFTVVPDFDQEGPIDMDGNHIGWSVPGGTYVNTHNPDRQVVRVEVNVKIATGDRNG